MAQATKTKAKTTPKKSEATECAEHAQASTPQHGSIVHVEFTIPDFEKSTKFYSQLFGWQFFPHEENELYFQTPGGFGPCGCVHKGTPATDGKTKIFVNVTDIPTTLAKATKLGAKTVMPKTEIKGGHGFYELWKDGRNDSGRPSFVSCLSAPAVLRSRHR
jgi:uncharacterized protein